MSLKRARILSTESGDIDVSLQKVDYYDWFSSLTEGFRDGQVRSGGHGGRTTKQKVQLRGTGAITDTNCTSELDAMDSVASQKTCFVELS